MGDEASRGGRRVRPVYPPEVAVFRSVALVLALLILGVLIIAVMVPGACNARLA